MAVGIALAAYACSIYFFSPRFLMWKGLHFEPGRVMPEVNRAIPSLEQLANPLVTINDPGNVVLQWRLFFPLIGHLLGLSPTAFLLIPHLGCLTTLTYIAAISRRYFAERKQVFFVVALMATTSWFFVSSGWLSYEDSWYIFGLLLISFSESRLVLGFACMTAPYIDERFILMLPLTLAVRWIVLFEKTRDLRRFRNDVIVIAVFVLPYVTYRLCLLKIDAGSSFYIKNRYTELVTPVAKFQYLLGWWMGLRLLWIAVIAGIWRAFDRRRWHACAWLSIAVVFAVLLAMVIAADLSRSMSAVLPAALLGVFLLNRDFPQMMSWGLPTLLAGNLLLPACHVVTLFNEPIFYVYSALDELAHPPPRFNVNDYLHEAQQLLRIGDMRSASDDIRWALQLDPQSADALAMRSWLKADSGDLQGAIDDSKAAMKLKPDIVFPFSHEPPPTTRRSRMPTSAFAD